MRWLRLLLSRFGSKGEPEPCPPAECGAASSRGLHLDYSKPYQEIDGPTSFARLFRALDGWLPEGSVLYLEGGDPDAEIESFLAENAVPEQVHIARGTIWPTPRVCHVPGTSAVLRRLAEIMDRHAEQELAWHFHVYREGVVLLEWHDAFDQPMLVRSSVPGAEPEVLVERFRSERVDHP